jgi:nucleolar complex protein 3
MIKERKFVVNPKVLSCLKHLRLKTELIGVRASKERAEKFGDGAAKRRSESKNKLKRAKGKAKPGDLPHLSKKAKKALKETKGIEKEMVEAEAEVDREERTTQVRYILSLSF